MKIPLPDGRSAIIDKQDWWLVGQFHWYAHSTGYAFAGVCHNGNQRMIKLHRLISGFPPFHIDHRNGNGLDNRRRNLRPCTHSQNLSNRGKQRNNTSGFKGVCQHGKKWRAKIWVDRRQIHLGYFNHKHNAALAYKNAARKYHGEFAHE